MRYIFLFAMLVQTASLTAQPVGNLNLNYIYNPDHEISLVLKPVNAGGRTRVFYVFQVRAADYKIEDYSIAWEKRESFYQRDGSVIEPPESDVKTESQKKSALLSFDLPQKPWLLIAKVKNIKTNTTWTFAKTLEANYPVNGYLSGPEGWVDRSFVARGSSYTFYGPESGKQIFGFYYKGNFLPGSPPFVESESRVDRFLFHDSTFRLTSESKIQIKAEGLYLFQEDTASESGVALLGVRTAYPRFTRVEDLIKPMIYLCTQKEYDQLKAANGDKVKFDKVVLEITGDKDRAKNFIRSYFRRVELANLYFTSYKEGWKTDRGMIYLIFGNPTEVTLTGDSEVWRYKNIGQSFTFVKTGSVYGPDYFVLVRDKRYTESWYTTIDLWRKSRF